MITHEDTYEVAGQVLEIPVTAIRRADDNVRTDLGDLEELAASIREVGVLQAITVTADVGGDTFTVLMGSRRHAASELAGVLTIPAVIRTKPEDKKRVITMLIENVHRADLSPLDEARTFARLEKLGVAQADISTRVGCSQSHVSKRLSLLTLPAKAHKMLTAGELNIGDAVELARLAEHPAALKSALTLVENGWEAGQAAKRELAKLETTAALAQALADAKAKGVEVLATRNIGTSAEIVKAGTYSYNTRKSIEFDKPAQHAKEPCHAITLTAAGLKVDETAYCVAPTRHNAKGDSTLKLVAKAPTTQHQVDPAIAERNAARAEARARRAAFAREVVQNLKLDRPTVTTAALKSFVLNYDEYDDYALEPTAELLGIDLLGRDLTQALTDYMNDGTDALIRACLATLLARTSEPISHDPDPLAPYGYEPTPWELDERAQSETRLTRLAINAGLDAIKSARERAIELDSNNHFNEHIELLERELDEGCSSQRAVEIRNELDTMFVELNNIQPGDVVDADDQGHTIERSAPEQLDDAQGDELDPNPDSVLCAFPGCVRDDEHDGDHVDEDGAPTRAPIFHAPDLGDYVKAPKDCSTDEAWAREQIKTAFDQHPDGVDGFEVRELARELRAGVDDTRATEIRARLDELITTPVLDGYTIAATSKFEADWSLIAYLDPTDERVIPLQQELYAGVGSVRAGVMRRELKSLVNELAP